MYAAWHEVYFGTEPNVLNHLETLPLATERRYVGPLALGQTYYWRVDEVNDLRPDSPWIGDVWWFTVADYLTVDDFEDYDYYSNRIFYTWRDGRYCGPSCPEWCTGSIVWLEPNIVHGGMQSMAYYYDKTPRAHFPEDPPPLYYSEATAMTVGPNSLPDIGYDWTYDGVKALSLWFYGDPCNFPEPMFMVLEDGIGREAVVYHDDPNVTTIDTWTEWNIALSEFETNNPSLELRNISKISIGFAIRGNMEPVPDANGLMFIDDIRLYRPRCVPKYGPIADFTDDCLVDFTDLREMADSWLSGGPGLKCDLNEDGQVNLKDCAILAKLWLVKQLWPTH